MKIKVGWVLVIALLVSVFFAPTAYAVRRSKNIEVANYASVADDHDVNDEEDGDLRWYLLWYSLSFSVSNTTVASRTTVTCSQATDTTSS
ncbi:hypothetical protein ACLB2K_074545 [Fragaria x ananassa]